MAGDAPHKEPTAFKSSGCGMKAGCVAKLRLTLLIANLL
jgi:hypothetical protein